jgi:hypothetical protein
MRLLRLLLLLVPLFAPFSTVAAQGSSLVNCSAAVTGGPGGTRCLCDAGAFSPLSDFSFLKQTASSLFCEPSPGFAAFVVETEKARTQQLAVFVQRALSPSPFLSVVIGDIWQVDGLRGTVDQENGILPQGS